MHRVLVLAIGLASAHANPPHQHAGSGVVALDVVANGDTVDLLTVEQQSGKPSLIHIRSIDGGETWSVPSRIGGEPPFGPRRGNDPQIAATGARIVAVWTTAGTDQWGSGPMATALSIDGGKTWSAGPNPADDNSTTGHGFIDLAADKSGRFHIVWLDSRDGKQGLRYANSADGSKWSQNVTVMPGTCECCPNTLSVSSGRIAVLYRAHDPRDMHVAVSEDAGATWKRDSRAGAFEWKLDGCPHAGGGLSLANNAIHAIVWTGEAQWLGVHHLMSNDGSSWSSPVRIGTAEAAHPDLASDGKRIAAVWESGGAIWTARSADGAKWSEPLRIRERNSTHPRVVATRSGFRAFWSETPDGKKSVWRSRSLSQR